MFYPLNRKTCTASTNDHMIARWRESLTRPMNEVEHQEQQACPGRREHSIRRTASWEQLGQLKPQGRKPMLQVLNGTNMKHANSAAESTHGEAIQVLNEQVIHCIHLYLRPKHQPKHMYLRSSSNLATGYPSHETRCSTFCIIASERNMKHL